MAASAAPLPCTASYAANYAPSANVDDGLCFVLGCTDSTATNYEPLAPTDDALRDPARAAEHKATGNKLFAAKDYERAADAFTTALGFDPRDHVFYSNRSACRAGNHK